MRLPGELAPEQVARDQMVPGTVDANLDRVATELVVVRGQVPHPSFRIDNAAGELLQLVAKDVSDLPEILFVADRAKSFEWDPNVSRRPE